MADNPNTMNLTAARLREVLHYDPQTGALIWLPRPVHKQQDKTWNKRYAGKEAGCVKLVTETLAYRIIVIRPERYRAHHLAWLYMTGEFPSQRIDHENGDGLFNAWDNLRLATPTLNGANSRRPITNTTGFKGVTIQRDVKSRPFKAQIQVNGKNHHIGLFESPEAAHEAYLVAARKYFGEFARGE